MHPSHKFGIPTPKTTTRTNKLTICQHQRSPVQNPQIPPGKFGDDRTSYSGKNANQSVPKLLTEAGTLNLGA